MALVTLKIVCVRCGEDPSTEQRTVVVQMRSWRGERRSILGGCREGREARHGRQMCWTSILELKTGNRTPP